MFETIKNCNKCGLCKHQSPLMDNAKVCQVFWVGLSAKTVTFEEEKPLSPTTNSGKLISSVEERCEGILTYKTNLVKCVPLDEKMKLRYPNKKEIDICFPNLETEINYLKPRIIFLLGDKVTKSMSRHLGISFAVWEGFSYKYVKNDNTYYIPIHHPSYIHVYKRKQMKDYVFNLEKLISALT